MSALDDEILFGWDPTPGIVSVWADHDGEALVWRRIGGELRLERERFRPWLLAVSLDDVLHLGDQLAAEDAPHAARALVRYQELDGEPGSYRYLLTSRSGRALGRAILQGAAGRREHPPRGLHELGGYHRVGPVEQYLMATGRVYFRGLRYDELHRMQIDLETTGLDPRSGRIFMAAVRDTRGLAVALEAPSAADERGMIEELCAFVRGRDPDVIETVPSAMITAAFLEMASCRRTPATLTSSEVTASPAASRFSRCTCARGTRKMRRLTSPEPLFTATSLRIASMMNGALLNLSKANNPDLGGAPTTASGASPASVMPPRGRAAWIFPSSALNRAV